MNPKKILSSCAAIAALSLPIQAATLAIFDDFEGATVGAVANGALITGSNWTNTANGNTQIFADDAESDGKYVGIAGDTAKHITSATLENLTSFSAITVSADLRFIDADSKNNLYLQYSSAGDFSDTIPVQYFNPELVADLPNYVYEASIWYTGQTVTITDGVGGITFANTAKLRWTQDGGGFGNYAFLDNISVQGVPEPSTLGLTGLAGLALLLRRRRN